MIETFKPTQRLSSFQDLEVYQQAYQGSIVVMTTVLPRLPAEERDDLRAQLRRSCKAVPRLIAEGYAKRHQVKGFQKYLDDANGECNEMVVSLSHCRDLYGPCMDRTVCDQLIDRYDKLSRQLFKLATAWSSFHPRQRQTQPQHETPFATATTRRDQDGASETGVDVSLTTQGGRDGAGRGA